MKILITGAGGQLAKSINDELNSQQDNNIHAIFAGHSELDITNFLETENFINKLYPLDFIINCAAYTDVEGAEDNQEEAFSINAEAPGNLSMLSSKFKCTLIHFSTDFVFSGTKNTPYKEDDLPSPLSVYGKSKYAGEKTVLENSSDSIIIRLSWLYSRHGNNFVKKILSLAESREEISVVSEEVGSPTSAHSVATALPEILKTLNNTTKKRIYHFSDCGYASRFEQAQAIVKLSGYNCRIIPAQSGQFNFKAKRPIYSVLDNSLIQNDFKLKLPSWLDAMNSMFSNNPSILSKAEYKHGKTT